MTEPRRRLLRSGELLAIREEAVHSDRGSFFWLFAPAAKQNERHGAVAVVTVNGPLDHHDEGAGESYEAIVNRVRDAMAGTEDDGAPSCVVMRIDSPGGAVAGLDQCVRKLKGMSETSGIPLYCYVDEECYSAGYALSCACEETALWKSAFVGSIGVISTMADQSEADKKAGLKFVVLTSGARKADGHPHVPISDAMIAEERPRVQILAKQFFALVRDARGVPRKTIDAWQAKRFLGQEAIDAGLADYLCTWDEYLSFLQDRHESAQPGKSQLAPPGRSVPRSVPAASAETNMPITAIDQLKSLLRAEKDPEKLSALTTALGAYTKERHTIEKHEKEKSDPEDDEKKDEDEEDAEAKKAEGDETDRDDDEKKDEGDDEDEDDTESKKSFVNAIVKSAGLPEKAKRVALRMVVASALDTYEATTKAGKVLAAVRKLTGKKSAGAIIGSLEGKVAAADSIKGRLAALETDTRTAKRNNLVDAAFNARRITKHDAKTLKTKKLSYVEEYLDMHKTALVNSSTDELLEPDPAMQSGGAIPAAVQAEVDRMLAAVSAAGVKIDPAKFAEKNTANGAGKSGKVI